MIKFWWQSVNPFQHLPHFSLSQCIFKETTIVQHHPSDGVEDVSSYLSVLTVKCTILQEILFMKKLCMTQQKKSFASGLYQKAINLHQRKKQHK